MTLNPVTEGHLPHFSTHALLFHWAGRRRLHQDGKEVIGRVMNIILPNPSGVLASKWSYKILPIGKCRRYWGVKFKSEAKRLQTWPKKCHDAPPLCCLRVPSSLCSPPRRWRQSPQRLRHRHRWPARHGHGRRNAARGPSCFRFRLRYRPPARMPQDAINVVVKVCKGPPNSLGYNE